MPERTNKCSSVSERRKRREESEQREPSRKEEKKSFTLSDQVRKACEDNLEFSRLLYGEIAKVRTKCVEFII